MTGPYELKEINKMREGVWVIKVRIKHKELDFIWRIEARRSEIEARANAMILRMNRELRGGVRYSTKI